MTDKSIPEAIQRLFGERDEARAEAETLRSNLEQAARLNAEMRSDIEAATRREGKLHEALERAWAPPPTEAYEPTAQEMALATLNEPAAGMRYDAAEPEPEWGTAEHIDQLPTYRKAPREAPQPPPAPARPRASTPTLRLTED